MQYSRLRMYTSNRGLECSISNLTEVEIVGGNYVFERGLYYLPLCQMDKHFHGSSSEVEHISVTRFFENKDFTDTEFIDNKVKEMQLFVTEELQNRLKKIKTALSNSVRVFPATSHHNEYSFTNVANKIFNASTELK